MAPDRSACLAGGGGGGSRGYRCQDGLKIDIILVSVPDPNPDPHVFGLHGSISQRYGPGSGSGSFIIRQK